jgi:N utilization substance protein B
VRACDDLISAAAVRWKLSRLSHVDRAILRMSVYQLRYCEDIPCKVVINEAIEIAKKYSTEQSPRFVNGVLDAVLKKLEHKTPVQESSTEESVP